MGLDVAIPDTALRDCSDLREKTIRIGRMGRAFAIFRVECVFVYTTGLLPTNQKHDSALLLKLLRFMDTPQYLRRRVFPHSPDHRRRTGNDAYTQVCGTASTAANSQSSLVS